LVLEHKLQLTQMLEQAFDLDMDMQLNLLDLLLDIPMLPHMLLLEDMELLNRTDQQKLGNLVLLLALLLVLKLVKLRLMLPPTLLLLMPLSLIFELSNIPAPILTNKKVSTFVIETTAQSTAP
jgi:hypothetical protein